MRRWWFFAQGALVAAVGVLAFPGEGSALAGTYTISLTSTGPSPVSLTREAGPDHVVFRNTDTVTHSIAFANGLCSEPIAADGTSDCDLQFLGYAGSYAYTVDGTSQGNVIVDAITRSVTLTAKTHWIHRGSLLRLRGRLQAPSPDFPGPGFPQPVMILSRPDRQHPYHRVAVVKAKVIRLGKPPFLGLGWHLRTRPKAGTVYTAEAVYQPRGGRLWTQAFSKPFRVQLHR